LAKTGKNEVRVTQRAVEILFPDNESSRAAALREAANEPELFQRVMDRFTDGIPSEAALEAFLIRQGFTYTAIPPATRAFRETFLFLENEIGSESYQQERAPVIQSQPNQQVDKHAPMTASHHAPFTHAHGGGKPTSDGGPDLRFAQRKIWLSGVITTRAEAEEFIATINALKAMLKAEEASPAQSVSLGHVANSPTSDLTEEPPLQLPSP